MVHNMIYRAHIEYIEQLVRDGGPRPDQYDDFTGWLSKLRREVQSGTVSGKQLDDIRSAFGDALSLKTCQGYAFQKPRGYAGDFEIIDRIYCYAVSDDPHLANWDRYGHSTAGPISVRERKKYFHSVLEKLERGMELGGGEIIKVLDVGSGSTRDIAEYFDMHPDSRLAITCLDIDPDAIEYSQMLCRNHLNRINFICDNIFRFRSSERFDLIWSGGLFDYFDDRKFCFVLKNLMRLLKDRGELIVGNFSTNNGARDYMELILDWHLEHRTSEDLIRLAIESGCKERNCKIDASHAVLFLHVLPNREL